MTTTNSKLTDNKFHLTMAEAELKRLRAAAGQCKAQFTRFEKFLNGEKTHKTTTDDILKMRFKSLDKAMEDHRKTQLQINILLDKTSDEDFLADDLEERYYAICEEVNKLVKSSQCTIKHGTTKLPHLDIPVFSGDDVTKYTSFIEIFYAVIGRDQELAPVQKLCYLRKYLSKEAGTLIESLPLVDSSYDEALQLLKNRYDNKCILVTSHVHHLLDYPAIVKGTAHNLRELVSNVRQHLSALRNMQQPVDSWDMLLLPIILRKLDQFSCRTFHSDRDKGQMRLGPKNPILLNTRFGYVVAGEVGESSCLMSSYMSTNPSISTVMHCMPKCKDEELSNLMERFWEMETLPPMPVEREEPADAKVSEAEICEIAFKSSVQLIDAPNCDLWDEKLQLPGHKLFRRVSTTV